MVQVKNIAHLPIPQHAVKTEVIFCVRGVVSPLLANVYLHYVFDLWAQAWRRKRAHGDLIVVRFADDIVVGFYSKADADQFRAELTERMRKFNLELHPETNGSGVEKGNRRRSTSWALRISA